MEILYSPIFSCVFFRSNHLLAIKGRIKYGGLSRVWESLQFGPVLPHVHDLEPVLVLLFAGMLRGQLEGAREIARNFEAANSNDET